MKLLEFFSQECIISYMGKKTISEIQRKIEQILEITQEIQDCVDELESADVSDLTQQWVSDLEEYLESEDEVSLNTLYSQLREL